MPSRFPWICWFVALSIVLGGLFGSGQVLANGEATLQTSSTLTDASEDSSSALPFPRGEGLNRSGRVGMSSDHWPATLAVVLALVLLGAIGLASRKFRPATERGPLQVVGRAALSPKHAVYLLRVGDRVLIVGAGTQGPPALLGELNDPDELERLIPGRGPSESTPTELLDSGEPNGEKA